MCGGSPRGSAGVEGGEPELCHGHLINQAGSLGTQQVCDEGPVIHGVQGRSSRWGLRRVVRVHGRTPSSAACAK